ncbi:efflux transporter outer membrane subunit [Paraburkholderia solisilvae]|uniref:Outer membrane protein OprM n=1 Tax=Paraburkholderia solisilvae TaxID=624376 RepID=A0A6J5ETS9_9BURK|nr:Outer membrane protein OprM [Paraburkholderia solisilvae]
MTNGPTSSMRKSLFVMLIAAAAGSLAACSTLPAYTKPDVAVPAHYAGASATPAPTHGWSVAAPADTAPRGPWWSAFDDAELNSLEARVDVSNQTVKQAVAQLQQARAMVAYQRAGFFPTVTAGASALRYRTSQNVKHTSRAGVTEPDYLVGLNASWEPDLFGRVRDATVGARDEAQATQGDLDAVRLSISADLAADYFDLRALDIQKKLLDDTVTAYAAALKIIEQQFQKGVVDASAVAQAQTQLESTRTQDTDIDVQRAQLQHAIATLIGEPASTFTIAPDTAAVPVPAIPPGLPSQLLERRPDIAAAERRVAEANAQIGEARAAYYPNLTLSASAGLESTFFAPWLTAPSLFWSLGSQIAGTLIDGGRRDAALQGAHAQYDGVVAGYRQTVLVAFQQVEDQLSALNTLASEAQSQQRAASAAERSLQLTTNRFNAGAVSYLDVVTAQTIALTNERTVDQIDARRIDASVQLLKSLGGGWDRAVLTSAENAK